MLNDIILPSSVSLVNSLTGEVENKTVVLMQTKTKPKTKSGWNKMYRVEYDRVTEIINSKKDHNVFTAIRDSNLPKSFILSFNQTHLSKRLKVSLSSVSRVVSKLKSVNFIMKIDNTYRLNPLMYIPPMIDDNTIHTEQILWRELLKEKGII